MDAYDSEKSAIFGKGGCPNAVRGEEDPKRGVREEEEGIYDLYSDPEESAQEK